LRIIATLHNRRGDPLLLLRLLRILKRDEKVGKVGVAWSVPSGRVEPSWEELVEEESRVQESLRNCVSMVHESGLSWEARSFLGRCYRSFQYEFMVSLNLKRHDPEMRIMLIDDPGVRDLRYQEIRNPREFLAEVASLPVSDQARALRSRYDAYRAAYEDMRVYERMILHSDSALLEVLPELARLRSREEYIAERIEESKPDVVLLRLVQCLTKLPTRLESILGTIEQPMAGRLASMGNVMKLAEAERIVGPLPARD